MSDYDNTNRGALFRNDRKEKDTHPDHQGTLNVEGDEYWLSAWIKTSKKGQKFFSLSVKPKEDGGQRAQDRAVADGPGASKDFDDDIPF